MRNFSALLITLCLFVLKLDSGTPEPYVQKSSSTAKPPRGFNNKRLEFWNGNSPKNRVHVQTASFRSKNNEDKTKKWPKVKKTAENNVKALPRATRLMPLPQKFSLRNGTSGEDNAEWHRLNPVSIRTKMEEILKDMPGTNATVKVIAKTMEYNEIVLCKIRPGIKSPNMRANEERYADEEPERKIVLIVHGLSSIGFKLVPCLSNQNQFKQLLEIYLKHLDKFDIYLVPMANPDGIGDNTLLFWNKNKSPQAACGGVALDRNFDVAWSNKQISSCNQQYPGPEAFSEVESRAIAELMHIYSHRLVAYIHVHGATYSSTVYKGDAVLYPKGYSETNSEDDKYIDMKGDIEDAMKTAGFRSMSVTVDTLYNWYGAVQGSSVDYASSIYGIPYALEFVMQAYADDASAKSSEKVSSNVLTEVWARVIDVVFEDIHKNTQNNDA